MAGASSLPLAFGVPSTAQSFAQSVPVGEARATRASRAAADELGDFVQLRSVPSAAPPPRAPPKCWSSSGRYDGTDLELMLHEDLIDFWHAFRPTRAEADARAELVSRVKRVVRSSLGDGAEIVVFGSFASGLYLPESDVDLMCTGAGLKHASKPRRVQALQKLGRALRSVSWPVRELEVVDRARVPIVKFVDGATGVAVDIGIETADGSAAHQLSFSASREWPAYGVLVLALKRYLNMRGLHDTFTGGVGSFLLQLLVICSLQHPPAARERADERTRGNLGRALLHFFELFGLRYNYELAAITVAGGGRFLPKRKKGWDNPERPALLAVENPFDADHDVGANSFNIASVRRAFSHGYFSLLAAAEEAREAREGRWEPPDGDADGAGGGRLRVLGAVLDVEAEMSQRFVQHRLDAGGEPSEVGGTVLKARVAAAVGQQEQQPEEEREEREEGEEGEEGEEESEEADGGETDDDDDEALHAAEEEALGEGSRKRRRGGAASASDSAGDRISAGIRKKEQLREKRKRRKLARLLQQQEDGAKPAAKAPKAKRSGKPLAKARRRFRNQLYDTPY